MVLESITTTPCWSDGSTPSGANSRRSTAAVSATHIQMTSAFLAASAGEIAVRAPSTGCPALRFHTATSCPAFTRFAAIGRPIIPKPRKATRIRAVLFAQNSEAPIRNEVARPVKKKNAGRSASEEPGRASNLMSMLNVTIRRKARQFGRIVRHSALTPRTGQAHKPLLAKSSELGITFIGHSGFFIQVGGKNIVVDPNFARWLFVLKRLRRPGLKIKDLPAIDHVLVTHAHFDHLSRTSLRAIVRATRRRSGRTPEIIIPTHVRDLVRDLGFRKVHELEWWEEHCDGALSIVHTPAQHWGARMLRDYHRGYGGYVIRAGKHSLYHAGDSAYFKGFREIGRSVV